MVVVVIAAIIASIAYPAYQGQMQKTRRADAKAALMDAAAKNGTTLHSIWELQWNGSLIIAATSSEGYYYNITATVTGASSQTFTITADAPAGTAQDGDDCGDYVIDQAQQKTVSGTLAANIVGKYFVNFP